MVSRPQPLGEDVSELKRRLNERGCEDTPRHAVTELMRMTQDVLSLLKSHRVGRKVDGGLAVQPEGRGGTGAKTEVSLTRSTRPNV